MHVLLVGGAVRNLLLGRPVSDKDFVVTGAGEEAFLRRFPDARKVGGHFPVFLVNGNEYALLRAENLDGDLQARDLTINAMALDEEGRLHCHPRALEDLRGRMLRPCGPESFESDPLRVYRAARFAAQYPDFAPSDDLMDTMRRVARNGLLRDISAERVGRELLLALDSPAPSRFLHLLDRTGCLSPWFREFDGASRIPAGPAAHHVESVLGHAGQVMDRLARQFQNASQLAAWMGMVHDLGKTTTPRDLWPSHPGHEERGGALARALGLRLRLTSRHVKAGEAAARLHMKAGRYPELRPGTRVDLLMDLHALDLVRELFALVAADHGRDHLGEALADLDRILGVRLLDKDRDQGAESGKKLRQLRADILAQENSRSKNIEL